MLNSINASAASSPISRCLRERLLRRARHNPNEFAHFAFTDGDGSPLVQATINQQLQDFLTCHSRALIELPRDHGKSMQICIRILWELGRRPGLRVKIVCASEALAMERGRFLRNAVADNRRLGLVFPQLRPAHPWGADRFTIVRPAEAIGPSVTAMGIGAASTGTRADLLICDDIVDVRAIRSAAERDRVKVYYRENLVNLLEPDGRLWNVFTPWHRDDLNAELKKNGVYALFRRAVGDDLTPVWPEKWPRERLHARRDEIGPTSFARAYRLVCVPDDAVPIRPESVRFWYDEANYERVILAVDPAVSAKRTADASALVTLGETGQGEIHCLAPLALRVPMPDLVNLIAAVDQRWHPQVILFEANAAFAGIRDLLIRHTSFGGKLDSITQVRDKFTRIQSFSVPVSNGTFKLRGENGVVDPSQQELFDEMTTFPVGEHDDLVDAAAFGTEYLLNHRDPRVW
jgi:predicted phage terminase large subunit-like protein